jgi:hypothetical protein
MVLGSFCNAQTSGYSPFRFDFLTPVQQNDPLDDQLSEPSGNQSGSIFANSPQWVLDLRRGEIVFFGTLPFTVFFTNTIMGLFRMGQHGWDQRYAPWPFQSAGAVALNNNEIMWRFTVAGSASLLIAIADHLIVRNKRKTAAASDY